MTEFGKKPKHEAEISFQRQPLQYPLMNALSVAPIRSHYEISGWIWLLAHFPIRRLYCQSDVIRLSEAISSARLVQLLRAVNRNSMILNNPASHCSPVYYSLNQIYLESEPDISGSG